MATAWCTLRDAVIELDSSTGTVTKTVNLPAGSYAFSGFGNAISPDGSTVYATDWNEPSLYIIDAATGALTTLALPTPPQGNIAITPDGKTLYAFGSNTVIPVDLATKTVGAQITLGTGVGGATRNPWDVAFSSDSSKAYITTQNGSDVVEIDVATGTISGSVAVNQNALGIAITPDDSTLWVCLDGSAGGLQAVTTASLALGSVIALGGISQVAISPDGTKGYVSGANSVPGTLYVADLSALTFTSYSPSDSYEMQGVAVSPDGSLVYVTDYGNGIIYPFHTSTLTFGTEILPAAPPHIIHFASAAPPPPPPTAAGWLMGGLLVG